jgi:hypothetical protein
MRGLDLVHVCSHLRFARHGRAWRNDHASNSGTANNYASANSARSAPCNDDRHDRPDNKSSNICTNNNNCKMFSFFFNIFQRYEAIRR